jgi:spore coat protein A, manganese oxidase
MNLSRRRFLSLVGGSSAAAMLAGCGLELRSGQTAELVASELPPPEPFRLPLPVPPVKRPTRTDGTTDFYEINQREAVSEILPGLRTPILGYDGIFPGPTIESRSGRRTVVRHVNKLTVPIAVHLHGGHTPAASDGYPIDLVLPVGADPHAWHHRNHISAGDLSEGSRDYVYPLDQRAATLWYHDHRMDFTGPQVYRGLAGFHLVRDDEEDALPLPRGDREVPLMITDRSFSEDGSFRYPSRDLALLDQPGVAESHMEGVLGDVILVNGAPWPELEVAAVRYRFRILNASNARRYGLALDPPPSSGSAFVQIGGDGGLLPRPMPHQVIDIAPAERFDVVVDFSGYAPGEEITLVNRLGSGRVGNVMRFRVVRRDVDDSSVPERLAEYEQLDPARAKVRRVWRFTRGRTGNHLGWAINGRMFDPERMDAQPQLGDLEIWRFGTDLHHPVHVHLSPFQVISRGLRGPGPFDGGWKDTVDVRPAEHVDVAVRFTDYQGPYLMHCHNLEHEDMGMMSAFETV